MLCTLSRARGPRGCRTRASAVGGLGAAWRGVRHEDPKTHSKLARSRHIHPARSGLSPWALVFLLLFFPRLAFASPSLEVDGNFAGYDNGEEYKGYVVVDSPDNYQSTLCLIGEYGKLVQITTEQYEMLSSPNTGGAFYELSQLWEMIGTNKSGTESYYPQWLSLSEDFSDGLVAVYGYGRVWAAVCTDSLKQQAKEDFNTILDGGSVGGGTGEPDYVIDGNYAYIDTVPNDDDMPDTASISVAGVAIPVTDFNKILEYRSEKPEFNIWVSVGRDSSESQIGVENYYTVTLINQEPEHFINAFNSWGCVKWVAGSKNYAFSQGRASSIEHNGKQYLITSKYRYSERTNSAQVDACRPTYSYYWGDIHGSGGGSGGGSEEPSPDPWEPPTHTDPPSNPNLPTPKDPITTDPPTLPGPPSDPTTPVPPQSPTAGNGGTYSVDIQGILDALDEHCIHIQTCLNSNFSGQNNYLGQLFSTYSSAIVDQIYNGDVAKIGAIQNAKDAIVQGFDDLFDYWDEYVKWLDKKLDFKWPEVDEYDDTDLLSWLKKIWARQGTGDVNTRPVDPAINYSGFGKWLGVLAGEIEDDVSDTTLSSLTSAIGSLQHTFPFSLPWDIQQILQALDATPVTPSASIPMLQWGASWDSLTIDAEGTYSYDVDLHWMDSAMVAVRAFELLAFVLYCLIHTKDVFGYVVGE